MISLVALSACAGQKSLDSSIGKPVARPPQALSRILPLENRIDLVPGAPVVLRVTAPVGAESPSPLLLELSGGAITAELWRLETAGPQAGDWLWAGASRGPVWIAVAELPADLDRPAWIELSGQRVRIQWLSEPVASDLIDANPQRPAQFQGLAEQLGPVVMDPTRSWRLDLLRRRDPGLAAGLDDLLGAPVLALPGQLLAARERACWEAAIDRLAGADAETASDLVSLLTAIASFPHGALAPVWAGSVEQTDELRSVLLDPARNGSSLVREAQAWMASQSPALTWVIDDAGAPGQAANIVTVGVLNRLGDPVAASLAIQGGGTGPVRAIGAFGSGVTVASVKEIGSAAVAANVRVGDWTMTQAVFPAPLPARAPGVRLAPFVHDWTLSDLAVRRPRQPDNRWATAALLQRSSEDASWEVFLECRFPAGGEEAGHEAGPNNEVVRIWLGPTGPDSSVIEVTPAGEMRLANAALGGGGAGEWTSVDAQIRADRWVARVRIPEEFVRTGALLVGMTRSDARGVRTAWPRPLTPWGAQPGRIAVDLGAWTNLRDE